MKLEPNEELMFKIMKAIYDSNIPISFKGSMVLKACLQELGYPDEIRHTIDFDGNWNTDYQPSLDQMVDSLQKALDENNIELTVKAFRMYGNGKSAGFEFFDRIGDPAFTVDIDVNRTTPMTKIYQIDDIKFRGIVPSEMIADKLTVLSSNLIFRRIKDLIDLYYFSKAIEFDKDEILDNIEFKGRQLGNFDAFLNRVSDLEHAYSKFELRGTVYKPPFNEVYESVQKYLQPFLPKVKTKDKDRDER